MWLATNVVSADVDDDETYGVDFTSKLPSDVTIESVEIEQSNDALADNLTIEPTVNTAEVAYISGQRNYTAGIGKFVSFDISGAVAGEYRIKVIATCSDGGVRSVTCRFNVVDGLTQA